MTPQSEAERMRQALEHILLLDLDRALAGPPIPWAGIVDGEPRLVEDVRISPAAVAAMVHGIARRGLGMEEAPAAAGQQEAPT